MSGQPGRSCPLGYRYRPEQLADTAERWPEDVLLVAGGLYGNPFALDALEAMAAAERARGHRVRLLFNGDFNWFNAEPELFRDINRRVLSHDAMLGNIEFELANPSEAAGCGCSYPAFIDQGVVERSNRIMRRLQQEAAQTPEIGEHLAALKRWRFGIFGGLNILVVHGDGDSLAGWGLSREAFAAGNHPQVSEWFDRSGADVIVSSHTCLPLLWSGEAGGRPCLVANNGSAGMANLAGDPRGLVVRISSKTAIYNSVARCSSGPVTVELVPLAFDVDRWLALFDQLWPKGSEAALSYRQRIVNGPSLEPNRLVL